MSLDHEQTPGDSALLCSQVWSSFWNNIGGVVSARNSIS